jgi:hypothetical protein
MRFSVEWHESIIMYVELQWLSKGKSWFVSKHSLRSTEEKQEILDEIKSLTADAGFTVSVLHFSSAQHSSSLFYIIFKIAVPNVLVKFFSRRIL